MKFSTRRDVEQPAEDVFAALTDFPKIERRLARRGVDLQRLGPASEQGMGMAWDLGFDLRGKRRQLRLAVARFDRPDLLAMEGQSEAFDLRLTMTVVALSLKRSRVMIELEVLPRNFRARLLIQTARLGKTQLDRRFAVRMAEYLDDITSARA